jgi:hypothetical protein
MSILSLSRSFCSNAIKFSPSGSKVTISVKVKRCQLRSLHSHAAPSFRVCCSGYMICTCLLLQVLEVVVLRLLDIGANDSGQRKVTASSPRHGGQSSSVNWLLNAARQLFTNVQNGSTSVTSAEIRPVGSTALVVSSDDNKYESIAFSSATVLGTDTSAAGGLNSESDSGHVDASPRKTVRLIGQVDPARLAAAAFPGSAFAKARPTEVEPRSALPLKSASIGSAAKTEQAATRARDAEAVAIVEISVADAGCGISEEDAACLFEAFRQVSAILPYITLFFKRRV